MRRLSKYLYNFCSKKSSRVINPYTHELLNQKDYISESEIFSKISAATKAHRDWKQQNLYTRIKLTENLVRSILDDKEKLKLIISSEIGKSFRDIESEFATIDRIAWDFIASAHEALKDVIVRDDAEKLEKVTFESIGLSLIFPYSSQPILDSVIHLIPCLITGGAALIKPSDYNHFLGGYLQEKAEQVLGRKGLVSDIFINPQQLPGLAQFRSIKKVIYSGSQSSARHIFQTLVKERFIDCNLFFGGQDAAYVDASADLEKAARQISKSAFYNNGQSYDCVKRLYLHESIQQEFLKILAEQVTKLTLGNPQNGNIDLGPICNQQQATRIENMIADAINDDATCVTGGMLYNDGQASGIFCQPTVLRNCSSDMPLVQTQIPAPILCTFQVASDQEFVEMVNQNQYGTGVRIFTENPDGYIELIDDIEVGRVVFNSASILNRNLPIEGWKRSGKGKILSKYSYQEYTLPKVFNIARNKK